MSDRANGPAVGRAHDAGMTLVEMLVALSLLGLIGALLVSSLSGVRILLDLFDRNDVRSSVLSAQTHIRKTIAGATRLPAAPGSNLTGSVTTAQFLTTYSTRGQTGGIHQISLQLAPSKTVRGKYDLLVTSALARSPSVSGAVLSTVASRATSLITNIDGLSLAYYGNQGSSSDPPLWSPEWTSQDRLPSAIRMTVSFPPGDPRTWPTADFPVHLAEQEKPRCSDPRTVC